MSRVVWSFGTLALVAALAAFFVASPHASQSSEAETVVLAELFTSEGCSSCPPADRALQSAWLKQPVAGIRVIPLSEHVDYWDHQGWKDPFSSPQFTARQRGYSERFNLESIYTPQVVIDGASELVGGDERAFNQAVTKAAREPKPRLDVDVAHAGANLDITVHGPGLSRGPAEPTDLMVALTEDDLVVDVERGENASRTLRHSGVVRLLRSLGDPRSPKRPQGALDSGVARFTTSLALQTGWQHDKLRVVAFVQSTKTRRVLSIGWRAVG